MEIVLYSYRVIEAAFPTILSLFGLHAFDLCKVIESVIRYETALPRPVVHHLIRIEEAIVESLAWTDSSPLFSLLDDPSHRQALLIQQKTQIAPAMSSLSVSSSIIPLSPGTFFCCVFNFVLHTPFIYPPPFPFISSPVRPTQPGGTPHTRGISHSLQVLVAVILNLFAYSVPQALFPQAVPASIRAVSQFVHSPPN